jgi:tryptophan 2,3-dioxygenase
VPTVVLHGAEDAEVPLSQFRDYAAADPGAELVSLPGTGHYTLIEPGSPACAVVIDLLTRLTGSPPVPPPLPISRQGSWNRPGGSTP